MEKEILSCIDEIDVVTQETHLEVMMSIFDSLVKSSVILEEYNGESLNGFAIVQEGDILDEVKKQGKGESGIVKALKFLPRLLMAIVKAIRNKFSKKHNKTNGKISIDIEDAKKPDSIIKKILLGAGIVMTVTGGGMLAFRIYESTDSVEFKDDVKFMISTDGSQLRIVFPFYKIDGMKEFNDKFKSIPLQGPLNDDKATQLVKLFDLVVINQARITERDFTIQSWDEYYEKEIQTTFDTFSKNIESLAKYIHKNGNNEPVEGGKFTMEQSLLVKTKEMTQKIVTDTNMIAKFDDKLHKTLEILMNPDQQSWLDKKKLGKITFDPVPADKSVDIYNIDTTKIKEAIKIINEYVDENKTNSIAEVVKNLPLDQIMAPIKQQFNCDFILSNDTDPTGGSYTISANRIDGEKISFSRTKGFDLGGMKIHLNLNAIRGIHENSVKFAGQAIVSIICHEIFHNVAAAVRSYDRRLKDSIKDALESISYKVTAPFDFVNDFLEKFFSKFGHRSKELENDMRIKIETLISSDNEEEMKKMSKEFANNNDINTNSFKGVGEKAAAKFTLNFSQSPAFLMGLSTIVYTSTSAVLGGVWAVLGLYYNIRAAQNIKRTSNPEEMMCDVFAAVYKLPTVWGSKLRPIEDKDVRDRKTITTLHDEHPSTYDRSTVSYNLANEMLHSGKIHDKETLDYLKYIVRNYEGINNTERHLSKGELKRIAPKFTSNINRAITNYINDNNIEIKE